MTLLNNCIASVLLIASLAHLHEASIRVKANVQSSSVQCSNDQYRPRFHFSPLKNWINDPNGLVYYDGLYHLFYQHDPYSKEPSSLHWGHAISSNLITWREVDIALKPDENGDIFSGSAVVDNLNTAGFKPANSTNDPIVAIFTSASGTATENQNQSQSLAFSLDKGMSFTKFEGNPVLVSDSADFRDPKVFSHNGKWIMSLSVGNKIEFYSSTNLKAWKKESEFGAKPEYGAHGGVWECPDLMPFNVDITDKLTIEQWVLLVSINPGGPNEGSATQYFVGNFTTNNSQTFTFETNPLLSPQWLDWGPDNYAGVTFSNEPTGRFMYLGWMSNWLYADATPTSSWRGQMTIPRELSLRVLNATTKQFRLVSTPIKEVETLRNPLQYIENNEEINLVPQSLIHLTESASFKTPLMEVQVTVEIENEPQFSLCAANSVNEEVCFGLNRTSWYLDRSKSGNIGFQKNFAEKTVHTTGKRELSDKVVLIRLFFDVSSIEIFTDDGITTMTGLHYPSQPFDRLFIQNWSPVDANSVIKVLNFKVWGLQCWFGEGELVEEDDGGASGSRGSLTISGAASIVLVLMIRFILE